MPEAILKVEDVVVDFPIIGGTVHAVKGVSFQVAKGETLAIVGESGSGKSVTARTIMGMLPEKAVLGDNTRILFGGRDLARMSEIELMALRGDQISMIFQEPMTSLDPLYTIGRQLADDPMVVHGGLSWKAARAKALELLQACEHSGAGTQDQGIPLRNVGRSAPARDDCHGACQ